MLTQNMYSIVLTDFHVKQPHNVLWYLVFPFQINLIHFKYALYDFIVRWFVYMASMSAPQQNKSNYFTTMLVNSVESNKNEWNNPLQLMSIAKKCISFLGHANHFTT